MSAQFPANKQTRYLANILDDVHVQRSAQLFVVTHYICSIDTFRCGADGKTVEPCRVCAFDSGLSRGPGDTQFSEGDGCVASDSVNGHFREQRG